MGMQLSRIFSGDKYYLITRAFNCLQHWRCVSKASLTITGQLKEKQGFKDPAYTYISISDRRQIWERL